MLHRSIKLILNKINQNGVVLSIKFLSNKSRRKIFLSSKIDVFIDDDEAQKKARTRSSKVGLRVL